MSVAQERWIESSDVVPMFPTLVWKILLTDEVRAPLDERLTDALAELRRARPVLERGEGWQSATDLHRRAPFTEIADCVRRAAAAVLRFLRISCETLDITGCWATVLAPGASHRAHLHPNNYLSAAYYLRAPAGADTIFFHDPRAQTAIIRPPVTALTAENTDQVVVRVRRGMLLLFPSFLEHSVDANASTEERVSLSFNLMFSGFAENLSAPLW